jgi:hypothetical protein
VESGTGWLATIPPSVRRNLDLRSNGDDVLRVAVDPATQLGGLRRRSPRDDRDGGQRKADPFQFITGRVELDDIVGKGFDELINNKEENVKILVKP